MVVARWPNSASFGAVDLRMCAGPPKRCTMEGSPPRHCCPGSPKIRNKDSSPVVLLSTVALPRRASEPYLSEGTVARVRNRTERDNEDLVRLYLEDIGRHQLLTKDDEARLAQDIEAGKAAQETLASVNKGLTRAEKRDLQRLVRKGEDAQRQFVQSNLRLVVSIAKRYQASGMPLLDLVQEGNLGLIHAVEKFDWRKGFKFSTYATWWIRQAIQRGIANAGRTIRLPVHAADNLARLQKERAGLEARLGRPATLDELAAELDLAPERVKELIPHLAEPVSLETP